MHTKKYLHYICVMQRHHGARNATKDCVKNVLQSKERFREPPGICHAPVCNQVLWVDPL